jgi:hypothetical protein
MDQGTISNWFTLLQSAGIIFSILLSTRAIFREARSRKISNYIQLTQFHREIWKMTMELEGLQRIRSKTIDCDLRLTHNEEQFLTFVFLHITCAFTLAKSNDLISIDQMKNDISEFLTFPLVKEFWQSNSRYYNQDFRDFVNACRKDGWTVKT